MKPLVIIPSFNTGPSLLGTVRDVLQHALPVWVVIDGSTDGSNAALVREFSGELLLRVTCLERNRGKGAALLHVAQLAEDEGYTHACCIDADGQHDASDIPRMLEIAGRYPQAMILGSPLFGSEAPLERVKGREIGNTFARIETLFAGPRDSLYGFRVYPISPLLHAMRWTPGGRRYDFDTEAVVRMSWAGVPAINVPSRVRYFSKAEGGVSHFHYLRDNLLLISLHTRLLIELLFRLPVVISRRRRLKSFARSAQIDVPTCQGGGKL